MDRVSHISDCEKCVKINTGKLNVKNTIFKFLQTSLPYFTWLPWHRFRNFSLDRWMLKFHLGFLHSFASGRMLPRNRSLHDFSDSNGLHLLEDPKLVNAWARTG